MSKCVICIAPNQTQAIQIVDRLKDSDFRSSDISVLMADTASSGDLKVKPRSKTSEAATVGAGSGAVLGGALAWLASVGSLAIPGIGPFIAAGPIVALIGGVAVGGALGGVTGALVGLGLSEVEARRYESKLKKGEVLISVHSSSPEVISRAKSIFEECDADSIATCGGVGVKSA